MQLFIKETRFLYEADVCSSRKIVELYKLQPLKIIAVLCQELSVAELKDILRLNSQKITGNKKELILRCTGTICEWCDGDILLYLYVIYCWTGRSYCWR